MARASSTRVRIAPPSGFDSGHPEPVDPVERSIRRNGLFARRRDLLAVGFTDRDIRRAHSARRIFRVRHGWYSVPDAPEVAIRAVRVGGRLTGISALETYGLRVPRRARVLVSVPTNACRLRRPSDRRARRIHSDPVEVLWDDSPRATHRSPWRVSIDDALLSVLEHESRDVAVASASAVMRHKRWGRERLERVFQRAPARCRCWLALVSGLDDSHGETFVRLWLLDAGIVMESQPYVAGVGRLDGRVSPHSFIEVDGGQHDPEWTGEGASTFESDHIRDTTMAAAGSTVLRFTYRQLYSTWPACLAAIQRSIADDLELIARRAQHPKPPRVLTAVLRKRRRYAAIVARMGSSPPDERRTPSF